MENQRAEDVVARGRGEGEKSDDDDIIFVVEVEGAAKRSRHIGMIAEHRLREGEASSSSSDEEEENSDEEIEETEMANEQQNVGVARAEVAAEGVIAAEDDDIIFVEQVEGRRKPREGRRANGGKRWPNIARERRRKNGGRRMGVRRNPTIVYLQDDVMEAQIGGEAREGRRLMDVIEAGQRRRARNDEGEANQVVNDVDIEERIAMENPQAVENELENSGRVDKEIQMDFENVGQQNGENHAVEEEEGVAVGSEENIEDQNVRVVENEEANRVSQKNVCGANEGRNEDEENSEENSRPDRANLEIEERNREAVGSEEKIQECGVLSQKSHGEEKENKEKNGSRKRKADGPIFEENIKKPRMSE